MKKIIFLFALFLISTPSFASDWFQLDEKNYIDLESVEQYKNQWGEIQHEKYSFWLKSLNDKSASFIDLEKLFKKKVWYQMTNFIVDCNQKTMGGQMLLHMMYKRMFYTAILPLPWIMQKLYLIQKGKCITISFVNQNNLIRDI